MSKSFALPVFCLLLLSLLLAACATNTALPGDGATPNAPSLYYFLTGTYSLHQGRYELAQQLLEKARANDPRSHQIRKYLLLSKISLFANDKISKDDLNRELQSTRELMDLDLYTLNSLYSVYSMQRDSLGMDLALRDLERNYPSSRIHLLRFYYNYNFKGEVDFESLVKAEKMADNEPEDLMLLAQIYSTLNPVKALQLVDRLIGLQASEEATRLRESILASIDRYAIKAVNFNALNYPEQKAEMLDHLNTLQKEGKSEDMLKLSDKICATGDPELLLPLAGTALFEGNVEVMRQIETAVDRIPESGAAKSKVCAIICAASLAQNEQKDISRFSSGIVSVADMESVLVYYLYYFANLEKSTPEAMPPALHESFHQRFAPACRDEAALLYLQAFSHAFLAATTSKDFNHSKAVFSQTLIDRGLGVESDFGWLSSYYYSESQMDTALAILREAVRRYPDNGEFLNGLGYSLLSYADKLEEALPLIRQAIALEPDNPSYLDSIAWYHYLKQDYYSALEYMRVPMRSENLHSEIAWHIGMIYKALGQTTEALSYFQKAVEIADSEKYQQLAQEELNKLKIKN